MNMERNHAVVLGGSMAGLAFARTLAQHFAKVTLVERDVITNDVSGAGNGEGRKGVPQSNQSHALLASGLRVLERLFPGLTKELEDGGAPSADVAGDFLWFQFGAWKLRTNVGIKGVITTRPALESVVRARVLALPQVTLVEGHSVDDIVIDAAAGAVTGVRVTSLETRESRTIDADLVVDATGRGSRAPTWLKAFGVAEVPESIVEIDVGYVTTMFERREGDLHGSVGGVFVSTPPLASRGGAAFAVQRGRWQITMLGSLGDHPPHDLAGYRAFAKSLPVPEPFELIRDREPVGPLFSYKFNANRRRHYERVRNFPKRFLVVGDALCSFNPIYGQGMSVALLEAETLDGLLAEQRADLAAPFFAAAQKILETPWAIAVGEDLRFPQVKGARPPGTAIIHPYMARAHRVASRDAVVLKRFFEVAHLLAPPTAMLAPGIALRVLRGADHQSGQASPTTKV
jgi:2-polyprenyl-6-methoxyphenol hydroxylase-like FAD-dependent oxidoreductase